MPDIYGSVANFKSYHNDRGNSYVGYDDDEIAVALLKASEFIDYRYFTGFVSYKTGERAQVREWPRIGVLDVYGYPIANSEIPREVENATYEAALKGLASPNVFFVDHTPNKYEYVAIDTIKAAFNKTITQSADRQNQFAIIDSILESLIAKNRIGSSKIGGDSYR